MTCEELFIMERAGKVASLILKRLHRFIRGGIFTQDIADFFEEGLKEYPGMEPAFKGFGGYPASLCVSINEEIIHGIPSSKRMIKEGDIVSVDLGIKYKGLFVDTAYTYLVGKVLPPLRRLVRVTQRSLWLAIKQARIGRTIGDIGYAVENFVEKKGFSVIRRFVGHGIGRELHLSPEIPNFGLPNRGQRLLEGMALAIEPMVSMGSYEAEVLSDGWTAVTKDRSFSAHFEHTVAITKKGPWVLTG